MSAETFRIGFLPLVDAALPILARELGFAEEAGIAIEPVRDLLGPDLFHAFSLMCRLCGSCARRGVPEGLHF